jgi:hypothetical protein
LGKGGELFADVDGGPGSVERVWDCRRRCDMLLPW